MECGGDPCIWLKCREKRGMGGGGSAGNGGDLGRGGRERFLMMRKGLYDNPVKLFPPAFDDGRAVRFDMQSSLPRQNASIVLLDE